jgi:hypothetical protein
MISEVDLIVRIHTMYCKRTKHHENGQEKYQPVLQRLFGQ